MKIIDFFIVVFFLEFLHVLYVSHKLNLLMLSSRLSYDQAWEEYNFLLFLFVYNWTRQVFMARVVCGVTHVTVAALFCSSSVLCISNNDWATENEAGRSESVNGNEEPAGEICHQYSSVVTVIIP